MIMANNNISMDKILSLIYRRLSWFYLSSYEPKTYGSIFHFYTNFFLIPNSPSSFESKWILFSLPTKEQIRFLLTAIMIVYHLLKYFKLIEFNDWFQFISGDITIMISSSFQSNLSLILAVSGLVLVTIIYDSFRTQKSLAFRTLIQYTRQDQQQQQQQQFSRSSSILMDYGCIKISSNFSHLQSLFNRFHSFVQIFHCKYFIFIHNHKFYSIIIIIIIMYFVLKFFSHSFYPFYCINW